MPDERERRGDRDFDPPEEKDFEPLDRREVPVLGGEDTQGAPPLRKVDDEVHKGSTPRSIRGDDVPPDERGTGTSIPATERRLSESREGKEE